MLYKRIILSAALASAFILQPSNVRAEVHISGSKEAVVIEAKNASVGEVIAALNSTFRMQINLKPEVHRLINGNYSGSLPKVSAASIRRRGERCGCGAR